MRRSGSYVRLEDEARADWLEDVPVLSSTTSAQAD
jgi:hypothetical protein